VLSPDSKETAGITAGAVAQQLAENTAAAAAAAAVKTAAAPAAAAEAEAEAQAPPPLPAGPPPGAAAAAVVVAAGAEAGAAPAWRCVQSSLVIDMFPNVTAAIDLFPFRCVESRAPDTMGAYYW